MSKSCSDSMPRISPSRVITKASSTSRSEEHTSELQSHSDLVCRLLLEKKKKNRKLAHELRTQYKMGVEVLHVVGERRLESDVDPLAHAYAYGFQQHLDVDNTPAPTTHS